MPAIFISHSSRDPQIADDIKTALVRLGFEQVFLDFDEDGIGPGEGWERRLYEELSRCHAVILVLTPNWLASTWCRIELAQARALGKVILPIVCAPIGNRYVLPEVQSVDLLDWKAGGLERVEQRLRAITNELARGFRLDPNRPPYPGIHAFEAEDAAIYFGRDDEARAVIERLDARRTQGGARCLVVIGASGSGKSSLLKAGVLPQLSRRRREWVVLPCIRPEKAPVETLAKAIAQQAGKSDDWRVWQSRLGSAVAIDHIEELLKDLRVGDARAATVLLPIDQFEEVFTVATPSERASFLHLLASALDPARDLPLMVIATGRSDVLEALLEAGNLAPITETFPLIPMPLDRVPRLVEGPAQVAGLNVEKGLAEGIARDVESPEALPLLAHTLWLLYRRGSDDKKLSLTQYQALGDPERHLNPIQNSVRLVADQAIGGLKPGDVELRALRDAFVPHLVRVRLDDGKRVRQPARLSELPSEALRLIRALVEARLLSTRAGSETDGAANDAGEAVVEVTHEALFQAWPTLDQWLTEEHAFLSDIERIKSAHDIWEQAPDAQKTRALLSGLLLSRARDWLLKYPQRFLSLDMSALRAFITVSARREDTESAKIRHNERLIFRGTVIASVIFALLAAAAAFLGLRAYNSQQQTRHELDVARHALDRVDRSSIGISLNYGDANEPVQANKCYYYGDGGYLISLSNNYVARYKRLGFSVNSLCMALVSGVLFDPESGKRLPTYFKTFQPVDDQEGERDITDELPLEVPNCFAAGLPYSQCIMRYDPWTGKQLSNEQINAYHNLGSAIELLMRTAITEGVACELQSLCGVSVVSDAPPVAGYLTAKGYFLPELSEKIKDRAAKIPNALVQISKATFYDVSPSFNKGFGYALNADGAAGGAEGSSRGVLDPHAE